MKKIGFIGLGHMGSPMVKNLLKHYKVMVYDLLPEAVAQLAQQGAQIAHSIPEVARASDIVFTMLQTGAQVKEVCLASDGLFSHFKKGALYIDCSSIDILTCRTIHEIAQDKKIAMIEAPVSGGVIGAQAATLTFMVGGSEENFHRVKPILECLGQFIVYAGPAGNGQAAKICNNMILGISMLAVSEGFILAKKLGLEAKKFFEIANNASGQCWSMSKYCPMPDVLENVPSSHQFVPGFSAQMMLKDLRLSQEAALHADVATPLGAQATALYTLFVKEGQGELDFSGIIKMIAGKDLDFA